jgi:hypothetical protein
MFKHIRISSRRRPPRSATIRRPAPMPRIRYYG